MPKFNLTAIRKAMLEADIDGWLFYDFHGSDPIGKSILNIPISNIQSRRWYYYIPSEGVPVKIVHSIEREVLDHLPGKKEVYLGWQEMEKKIQDIFKGEEKIATQYSPKNAIPYISRIDAGTFELLKSFKLKLVSSADLVQQFEARLTKGQLNTHINVAKILYEITAKSFKLIKHKITKHQEVNEYLIQSFMIDEMKSNNLIFDHPPLVATGENSGNPHYCPSKDKFSPIYPNSIVQFDIFAKENEEDAIYADISWVGFVGKTVPEEYSKIFDVIKKARDATVEFIDQSIQDKQSIGGWQADDVARSIVKDAGYESYFLHRTGHSIGKEIHANGANIDNLETKDERKIIPGTCFSIEPGIYFSDFGMRSEINVYVDKKGARVYTKPVQQHIVPILK